MNVRTEGHTSIDINQKQDKDITSASIRMRWIGYGLEEWQDIRCCFGGENSKTIGSIYRDGKTSYSILYNQ